MVKRSFTRRDFLKAAAVTAAGVSLAACAPAAPATEAAKPAAAEPTKAEVQPTAAAPAAPSGGKTVTIGTLDGELSNGVAGQVDPCLKATGIQIDLQKIPGDSMRTKMAADLTSGAGVYDIIIAPWAFVHEWQIGGHLVALDSYISADSSLKPDDFIQALYKTYGNWNGKQWTFPYKPDAQMFYYRKDLFDDTKQQEAYKSKTGKDLKMPTTFEDYLSVADFFTKSKNADSPVENGWSGMGTRWECIWWWCMRLADLGGGFYDEKMHPNFYNDAGKQALSDYMTIMKNAPADFLQYDWNKANTAYLSGKVAMMEQWPGLATMAETPEGVWGKSEIIGKSANDVPPGYTVSGSLVQSSVLGGWCGFISKYSKKTDDAYKTLAYITGPGEPYKIAGGNAPARKSTYASLQPTPETAYFPALLKTLDSCKITADVDAAPVSQQLQDYLSTQLQKILIGDLEPDAGLKDIDAQWTKILKDAGLYQ